DQPISSLGQALGAELLVPTRIYVEPVLAMREELDLKALVHITSDGLLNLLRIVSDVGFRLHTLPEPPPIFQLLQKLGQVPDEEMYAVFNMGIGFCVVVARAQAERALAIAESHGVAAQILGEAVAEPTRAVILEPVGLIGRGSAFKKTHPSPG